MTKNAHSPSFLSFPQSLSGNPEGVVIKMNLLIKRRIRDG